ncbi:hypothetical protein HNP49_002336 [Pseudomonas fluvialis]|uniref:Uncharacterized protein n=1 Tax=Pseudomonas fluvialis TaxID=1793966 RepID=A0A7X0EUH6_9PSED|nr:hypothetical protein [Pseudomonas fluvialis]MBB6342154.1 hypothetical protein [Pseudomonas fluvialis]
MKLLLKVFLATSLIITYEVRAQEYLSPHSLMLGMAGQYFEKLKTVFKDAYASDSTVQVMIRSSSPEKVIYIKDTARGHMLFSSTASVRVYDVDVKENWKEIEQARGIKIQGVDALQALGDVQDIRLSTKSRNISPELYAKLRELWQQELMSVRRNAGGKPSLTLDGATYDYSLRLSQVVFISGTAADGASQRLDKLASIAYDLELLVDEKKSEGEILKEISVFNQMPAI